MTCIYLILKYEKAIIRIENMIIYLNMILNRIVKIIKKPKNKQKFEKRKIEDTVNQYQHTTFKINLFINCGS